VAGELSDEEDESSSSNEERGAPLAFPAPAVGSAAFGRRRSPPKAAAVAFTAADDEESGAPSPPTKRQTDALTAFAVGAMSATRAGEEIGRRPGAGGSGEGRGVVSPQTDNRRLNAASTKRVGFADEAVEMGSSRVASLAVEEREAEAENKALPVSSALPEEPSPVQSKLADRAWAAGGHPARAALASRQPTFRDQAGDSADKVRHYFGPAP